MKLQKGNVFTPVCDSFCSWGWVCDERGWCGEVGCDRHPHGPRGRHLPPVEKATEAAGMHPTEMHSGIKVFEITVLNIHRPTLPPKARTCGGTTSELEFLDI